MTTPEDDLFLEDADEEPERKRPSFLTILISLLVLLALLATLIAPLLRRGPHRLPRPTPTPTFLQEAQGEF